ncbi:MAG: hypothetical protein ACLGIC_12410 [Acidimicrobiia bacterium]
MPKTLTTRALGVGFAAALVLGGAACGDDDTGEELDVENPVEGEDLGGEMEGEMEMEEE